MTHQSGVIVRIRLPPELERIRQRHDPVAVSGVPAHVTLLFPFLPADELTPAIRRRLAAIAAGARPFDVRFRAVRRFPGVIWLAPEPAEPFVTLTERIVVEFPGHPPYGGAHDAVIPHLTLGHGDEDVLARVERKVRGGVSFGDRVRAIELIAENGTDRWHRRWRIPLGSSVRARSTAPLGAHPPGRRGRSSPVRR